ncbi:hypothetical protein SBF1_3820002 [Candidatus Desulfosporosinus infrequens]|uniref:Uncharacterized protein n=1 Tax=Candidatus Desulfosporosinus infrequens TaxID=2043169 RepID=A0A2U3L5S9_9FIRM|nr:hypothetical protein SBF1_3820002 [Candidatus Desulfosporosinus infrequens]
MDRSYIPITKFYQNCLPAARNNGYKYVMCILARDRGVDGLYSALEQDWYALDDITGKDFLFMFTGKYHDDNQQSEIVYNNLNGCSYVLRNEYFRIMNLKPSLRVDVQYDFRERDERGKFTPDLPKNHTRVITELRRLFDIPEGDIPCLVYTNLHNGQNIIVPFSGNSIYDYFRKLYISLEKVLRDINSMSDKVAEYHALKNSKEFSNSAKIASLREELFRIANYLDEDEKNSLIDCILNMSYGKFRQDIRGKLNRYIDLSKNGDVFSDEKMALILSETEQQKYLQHLTALYEQADGIIRKSVDFANESVSHLPSPNVDMHQYGANSLQIGTVTNGGVLNIVGTSWRQVVLRKTFDMLEDFLTFMRPFLDVDFKDRNSYRLNNRLQDLTSYYERHLSDLSFLSEHFTDLVEISEIYAETLRDKGGCTLRHDFDTASISVISDCINSYWDVTTKMTHLICAEVV